MSDEVRQFNEVNRVIAADLNTLREVFAGRLQDDILGEPLMPGRVVRVPDYYYDPIPAPESTPATLGDLQAVEHRMTAVERAESEARAALDARIAKLELQVANIGRFLELLNSK